MANPFPPGVTSPGYYIADGTVSPLIYPNGTLVIMLPAFSLQQQTDVSIGF